VTRLHACLAELALVRLDIEIARQHSEEAIALADEIGNAESQLEGRLFLALALAGDELDTSLSLANQALEICHNAKLLTEESHCHRVLGKLHTTAGHYDEAERHLGMATELSKKRKTPYQHGLALLELGRLYQAWALAEVSSRTERFAKALVILTEAVGEFRMLGAKHDLQMTLDALSGGQVDK
jgi:tetratricopeptide (TPR) repeat protein